MKYRHHEASAPADYAPHEPRKTGGLWCPIGNFVAAVFLAIAFPTFIFLFFALPEAIR